MFVEDWKVMGGHWNVEIDYQKAALNNQSEKLFENEIRYFKNKLWRHFTCKRTRCNASLGMPLNVLARNLLSKRFISKRDY